jgi:FAD/FMN-containing dehydrogenase
MEVKEKLVDIVGSKYVIDDLDSLGAYSQDCSLAKPMMPNYAVLPGSSGEIQQIMSLASENRLPVIPSSSGVHFYGATIPSQGGIVLDLSRMNRILEVNELDRIIRLEPGVTWQQAQAEVQKHEGTIVSPLFVHPKRSVVTDYLEREVPTSPIYEYSEPLMSMEVVWANGEVFRTGSASAPGYPDSPSKGANPQGPGLDFFRLLQGAQGTMGVVIWAAVKYEYLSELNKVFFMPFKKLEDSIEPIYKIQRALIGNECFLLNNMDLATILAEKWPEDFNRLRETLPPWTLSLVVSSSRGRPEEKLQYQVEALEELNSRFLDIEILSALPGVPGLERRLPAMLRQPWPGTDNYWRFRYKGACQSLFFITVPEKVPGFSAAVAQIAASHGYPVQEVGGYVQPIERARACRCEFSFYYNPDDSGERKRVSDLYAEAAESMLNMGAYFTRPYGILADMAYSRATNYVTALKKVKKIFDPNNILNPGKLCF